MMTFLVVSSCGGATRRVPTGPSVDCQFVTLPPRFCGPSEDEMLWRESNPQPQRVCNGCFADDECTDGPGGFCVELPGQECDYSAFVCVYPDDPCFGEREGCAGECFNQEGRALCVTPEAEE